MYKDKAPFQSQAIEMKSKKLLPLLPTAILLLLGVLWLSFQPELPASSPNPYSAPITSSVADRPDMEFLELEPSSDENINPAKSSAAKKNNPRTVIERIKSQPELFKLGKAQLDRHIQMRSYSAEAFLTAARLTDREYDRGNPNVKQSEQAMDYLREAYNRYPNDPNVLMEIAMRSQSPEERREFIEALRLTDPSQGFGDLLSSIEFMKAGDGASAVNAFQQAGTKQFILSLIHI